MDEEDCLEVIGRHSSSMVPGAFGVVCAHRAHPSKDPAHRLTAVRLLAAGAGQHAGHLLLPGDSRDLGESLRAAAAIAVGEAPGIARALVSPAQHLRASGWSQEVVAEAEHFRCYLWRTDTGVKVTVTAHLAHDGNGPRCSRPYVVLKLKTDEDSARAPGLELDLTPADARPLAASLLAAAARVSPAADPG